MRTDLLPLAYYRPSKELRRLRLLGALRRDPTRTQRDLAGELGVTVTTVFDDLNHLEEAGFIERRPVSGREVEYPVTATGREALKKQGIEYLRETFRLYSYSKQLLADELEALVERGIRRAAFYTAGEVTELLLQALPLSSLEVPVVVDDDPVKQGDDLLGRPIVGPETVPGLAVDAVVITSYRYRRPIRSRLEALGVPGGRIVEF